MRSLTYDQCFDRLIGAEGGYVNDPNDAGGETKWGISKRSYPYLDIANLMAVLVSEKMFQKIGEKEIQIRNNASARTTTLLQKVFSRNWN